MMKPVKEESDDEEYVPAGLLNPADNTFGKREIKNEILEFYSENKSADSSSPTEKSSKESNVFVDLSEKKTEAAAAPVKSAPRVLRIPPGCHLPQLPSDAPKPPVVSRAYRPPYIPSTVLRPISTGLPISPIYPLSARPAFYPHRPIGYPTGLMPPTIVPFQNTYPSPYLPPLRMNPGYPPGAMMIPQPLPMMHSNPLYTPKPAIPLPPTSPQITNPLPVIPIQNLEEKKRITREERKKIRMEAAAKLKAERDARRAVMKAQKAAEKAAMVGRKSEYPKLGKGIKPYRKKEYTAPSSVSRKFHSFSKDMFVIRLRDVDSFDRNNEIWRIDNHILIQKFCGVPSLRAPARQFHPTNRLAGYDSRATWRLLILNPDNVEVDSFGSEITVHNFPSISELREAKRLAELKDEAFKEIEKSEFNEKLTKLEEKRRSRKAEKLKRRLERKKLKMQQPGKWTRKFLEKAKLKVGYERSDIMLHGMTMEEKDEEVCRDIIDELLDAVDDFELEREDSFESSDDEMSSSEDDDEDIEDEEEEAEYDPEYDDDDAGSLISMAHSSNHDEEEMKCELFGEDELPVECEVIVD